VNGWIDARAHFYPPEDDGQRMAQWRRGVGQGRPISAAVAAEGRHAWLALRQATYEKRSTKKEHKRTHK
jgi:hypothetical protein